tara:strand:+ start:5124 stop:6824 length:1701 start_codon:yes stop_codon:yes gene_type:complete
MAIKDFTTPGSDSKIQQRGAAAERKRLEELQAENARLQGLIDAKPTVKPGDTLSPALRQAIEDAKAARGDKSKRQDRAELLGLVDLVATARAAGVPADELRGLIKRDDLIAAGILMTPAERREARKAREYEALKARRERFDEQQKLKEERVAAYRERTKKKADERRAKLEKQRADPNSPNYTGPQTPDSTSGQADSTPSRGADTVPDNRPAPEQQGTPNPRAGNFGPYNEGRYRYPEADFTSTGRPAEELLAEIIDDPTGSKLPTTAGPEARFTGSKLGGADVPYGSDMTPAERLAAGSPRAPIPTPPDESQRIADEFTRRQAATRRAARAESERQRNEFVGPRRPLDQELRDLMDFGPTADDMSRGMSPSERLRANQEMGRQEYRTPPGESQRIADEFTRQEAIRTGQGQGALLPQSLDAFGPRDAMGRPVQGPAQPAPPLRPDASGSAVRDQVLQGAMNFGPGGNSPTQSIMSGGGLAGMLDVAPIQGTGFSFSMPSPMSQQEQVRVQLKKIRQENSDLADLDRLQSEIEKRKKLEERMRDRQPQQQPRPQNMFPGVPVVSNPF